MDVLLKMLFIQKFYRSKRTSMTTYVYLPINMYLASVYKKKKLKKTKKKNTCSMPPANFGFLLVDHFDLIVG